MLHKLRCTGTISDGALRPLTLKETSHSAVQPPSTIKDVPVISAAALHRDANDAALLIVPDARRMCRGHYVERHTCSALLKFCAVGGLVRGPSPSVAPFTFLPILRLSAAEFRTSQNPKPVLVREVSRLCQPPRTLGRANLSPAQPPRKRWLARCDAGTSA